MIHFCGGRCVLGGWWETVTEDQLVWPQAEISSAHRHCLDTCPENYMQRQIRNLWQNTASTWEWTEGFVEPFEEIVEVEVEVVEASALPAVLERFLPVLVVLLPLLFIRQDLVRWKRTQVTTTNSMAWSVILKFFLWAGLDILSCISFVFRPAPKGNKLWTFQLFWARHTQHTSLTFCNLHKLRLSFFLVHIFVFVRVVFHCKFSEGLLYVSWSGISANSEDLIVVLCCTGVDLCQSNTGVERRKQYQLWVIHFVYDL